jgi:hypothetical protein
MSEKTSLSLSRPRHAGGRRAIAIVALIMSLFTLPAARTLQVATPCGVVDAIDFPFLEVGADAWYPRFRFGYLRPDWGYHAGEDWFLASGRSYGQPVRAIADGLVTYAAPLGWGIDRGVVVIEHVMPSGARIYSMYGHLEELNDYELPEVGTCVTRGQIIGAIGRPSSPPHLHFEIRHMWPDTPGPGYWSDPPLTAGWENPSAFIMNWGGYLHPAYLWHIALPGAMTASPAIGPDGTLYAVGEGFLEAYDPDGWLLAHQDLPEDWRVTALVPDATGGVRAFTRTGEMIRFDRGLAYDSDAVTDLALSPNAILPVGNRLFLHTHDGALRMVDEAFRPLGEWPEMRLPQNGVATSSLIALTVGPFRPEVLFFSPEGELLQRATLRGMASVAAAPDGGIYVRTYYALWHVSPNVEWTFLSDDLPLSTVWRAMGSDPAGGLYLYSGLSSAEDSLLYSLSPDGALRRESGLGRLMANPTMAVGSGCALYLASSDGYLIGVRADTGEAGAPLTSAPGDSIGGQPWVVVRPDETVLFAPGGAQIVAADGQALAGLSSASACAPP